ncbi:MAG: hypothetical protein FWE48_06005 [Coriobacteriia bacterium]|nr:hypothetical protein [Coriobacteriia bacterium]MCL2746620.1 hypothetical protein [Coriobacteriia bacterium]MCL2870034.1 hypothetical protein [Coriobacteriia bacterium]
MKKILSSSKLLILAVLMLTVAVFAFGCGSDGLSVGEVQHDPFAFAGEVTINGTVTSFSPENPNLFGVMDTDELLICGRMDGSCGAWIMPTLYAGAQLPAITPGDNVVLTGEFVNMGDMVTFQVTDLDVGNNILNQLPQ